jgi:hypothetical protein
MRAGKGRGGRGGGEGKERKGGGRGEHGAANDILNTIFY